jgi:hypothetical protein
MRPYYHEQQSSSKKYSRRRKNHPLNATPLIATMPASVGTSFMDLSAELRLEIYPHLLIRDTPFLIGRCQELKANGFPRKHRGSPRDDLNRTEIKPLRDDRIVHRPAQPAISRVNRTLRKESLPIFYAENEFWLIHNEYEPEDVAQHGSRGFHPWLQQTPRPMFEHLQRVSLCGYSTWCSRYKIDILLNERKILRERKYSTYGQEMGPWWPRQAEPFEDEPFEDEPFEVEPFEDAFAALKALLLELDRRREWFANEPFEDAFAALNALLVECDWMFRLLSGRINSGSEDGPRKAPLAEGWDYEF